MKQTELVACESCGLATRRWKRVLVQLAGATVLDARLCWYHASQVEDAARRVVKAAA